MKNGKTIQILDELVSKIKFKDYSSYENSNEIPLEDKELFKICEYLINAAKDDVKNSAFSKSQFLEIVLFLSRAFEVFKIDKEKIKTEPFKSQNLDQLEGLFEVFEILDEGKYFDNRYAKLIEVTKAKFPLEKDLFNHTWTLSIFLDYRLQKQLFNFYKGLKSEIKDELSSVIKKIECEIENYINSSEDIKKEELLFKKTHTFTGKRSFFKYNLNEEMLEAFIKSIKNTKEKIEEWNNEVFDSSFLNKDTLKLILTLIEIFSLDDFLNKPLENLNNVFPENLSTSLSKKALYLNDILVIFEHPLGISEEGKEVYLKKEHYTDDDVRRLIISNITSIVKDLK